MLDSASPALSRIRKEVRIAHGRLMDRLNRFVGGGNSNPALQDAIVTSRDGRYVVPVRADSRNQVPGVVHDVSASGQTIFVEPLEVVELNNRWREAQIEETREVDRILDELSHETGKFANELTQTVDSVSLIDFAMAKARLAFVMRASKPVIWSQLRASEGAGHPTQRVRLRRARHPLLDPKSVVPIDIDLGEDFRVLLDNRTEYRRQDRYVENGRVARCHGAVRALRAGGRSVDPSGLFVVLCRHWRRPEYRSESFDVFGAHCVCHRRCWSVSNRPAWC